MKNAGNKPRTEDLAKDKTKLAIGAHTRKLQNLGPQWKPGQSGNPNGRPKGARSRLAEKFLEGMLAAYERGGAQAIEDVMRSEPAKFISALVAILPKQVDIDTDVKVSVTARYLRLRAGSAAAEQALRAYRDRHRSSMMARASEAFRTMSRGAYKGLASQPEKESEALVAVGADGGSKIASALSKGTRFQLYLALRVAGYHEFARSRGPVPFIADDIMETFDDFRAEEAFRLFAEMAGVGQVIYLTHHLHLCEIASRIYPSTQLHIIGSDGP